MIKTTAKASGCCVGSLTEKQFVWTIEDFSGVDTITFTDDEGKVRTASVNVLAITEQTLSDELFVVAERSYGNKGLGAKSELDYGDFGGIKVTDTAGDFKVTIRSDFDIVNMKKGATVYTPTVLTESVMVSELKVIWTVAEALGTFKYAGLTAAGGTYTTGQLAQAKAGIEAAFTALGSSYEIATVTESGGLFTAIIVTDIYPVFLGADVVQRIATRKAFLSGGSEVAQFSASDEEGTAKLKSKKAK